MLTDYSILSGHTELCLIPKRCEHFATCTNVVYVVLNVVYYITNVMHKNSPSEFKTHIDHMMPDFVYRFYDFFFW